MKLIRSIKVGNTLGESVLWNGQQESFWWTDIEERMLFRYCPSRDVLQSWATPHRVASFGFIAASDRLIVAFDRGIGFYDVVSQKIEWLTDRSFLPDGIRMNDGRVDRLGRFWVGSMVEDAENAERCSQKGELYRVDCDGTVHRVFGGIEISNGLCWSPDGATMYHADSPTRRIHAYRFDTETGTPRNRQLFADTSRTAHPDGAVVDADGFVWSAQWGGAKVVRYAPDGAVDRELALPVSQPTCVAFGGNDLSLLCVTSGRVGLSAKQLESEEGAGHAFLFAAGVAGIKEPTFRHVGKAPKS